MGIEDTCMNEKEIDKAIKDFHLSLVRSSYKALELLDQVIDLMAKCQYDVAYKTFQEASKTLTIALIENKLKEVRHDTVRD